MRDVIAVILIAVLIVGGYFGYRAIFSGEEAGAEPVATPSPLTDETPSSALEASPSSPQVIEEPGQAQQVALTQAEQAAAAPPAQPEQAAPSPTAQEDPAQKLFEQGRLLYSQNNVQGAADSLNAVISKYPESPYSAPAAATLAGITVNTDKWSARNLYSFAFDRTEDAKLKEECRKALDQLNSDLVFSATPSKDSESYQVQPGDVLTTIAAKYNCPYKFIMQINNIEDARKVRVGDRIKVLTGPKGKMEMRIVVDKSDFTLTVYLNNYYLKQYKVSLGRSDKTPVGTFTVTERVEKPEWRGLKHGDPKNILGDYWLTLRSDKFTGLGIHGTKNEPDTMGKNVSQGCIRMSNDDIKELYIMIPVGTQVIIQE